jgi:hypothetical protein
VEGGGCLRRGGGSLGREATGALGKADLEAVGEAAGDGLEVTHASGSGGLSPLGLLGPVVCSTRQIGSKSRAAGRRVNVHLRTLAAGYPHEEQVLFWMWKERRPQRRHRVCDLFCKVVRMRIRGVASIASSETVGYERGAFRRIYRQHPVSFQFQLFQIRSISQVRRVARLFPPLAKSRSSRHIAPPAPLSPRFLPKLQRIGSDVPSSLGHVGRC